MDNTITTQAVSRALTSAGITKSKSGGQAGRGGRWITEGFSTDRISILSQTKVAVSYEQDSTENYDETIVRQQLAIYTDILTSKGYSVTVAETSIPYLVVTK